MNLHLSPTLHSWEAGLLITADQSLREGTQWKWEHCSTVLNKRKLNSFCSVERSVDFWSGEKQFGWIKHERQFSAPSWSCFAVYRLLCVAWSPCQAFLCWWSDAGCVGAVVWCVGTMSHLPSFPPTLSSHTQRGQGVVWHSPLCWGSSTSS